MFVRKKRVQQRGGPADGSNWQAAANRLSENSDVRRHSEMTGRAGHAETKARNDLVENENNA